MLVGIDVENIVHTFVSTGDTSRIDWATVFKSAGHSDSRVLILERADLKAFVLRTNAGYAFLLWFR